MDTCYAFQVTSVVTTAATVVTPARYVSAILAAGAANVTVTLHDGNAVTSAATQVTKLAALANSTVSTPFPIRITSNACTVKLSAPTGTVTLGVV